MDPDEEYRKETVDLFQGHYLRMFTENNFLVPDVWAQRQFRQELNLMASDAEPNHERILEFVIP